MKSFLNSMSSSAVNSQIAPTPQLKKKPADDSSGTPVTGNNNNPDRFCSICQASFNNPLMAQQHYVGKKHRKQMTKLKLMETYGPSTAPGPTAEAWVCAVLFCFFFKKQQLNFQYAIRAHCLKLFPTFHWSTASTINGYPCTICNIELNSVEQYQSHISGAKHKNQ